MGIAARATRVYADGGLVGPRTPSLLGATFAWCLTDEAGCALLAGTGLLCAVDPGGRVQRRPWNRTYVFPEFDPLPPTMGPGFENNLPELLGIVDALSFLPDGWSGAVYSDNRNALGRLLSGWKCNGVPESVVRTMHKHAARLGRLEGVLLKGHPTRADLARGYGERATSTGPLKYPVDHQNVACDAAARLVGQSYLRWLAEGGGE